MKVKDLLRIVNEAVVVGNLRDESEVRILIDDSGASDGFADWEIGKSSVRVKNGNLYITDYDCYVEQLGTGEKRSEERVLAIWHHLRGTEPLC